MSSGTNQERIEQNNLKLAQLKTKVNNLPEYQDVRYLHSVGNVSPLQITASLMQEVSNGNITTSDTSSYSGIVINSIYNNYLIISLTNYNTQHNNYLFKVENDTLVYIDKIKEHNTNWSNYGYMSVIVDIDESNDIIYVVSGYTNSMSSNDNTLSVYTNNNNNYTKTTSIIHIPSEGNMAFSAMYFRYGGYVFYDSYLAKFNRTELKFDYLLTISGGSYDTGMLASGNTQELSGVSVGQSGNFLEYSYYHIDKSGQSPTYTKTSNRDYNKVGSTYAAIALGSSKCIFSSGVITAITNNTITNSVITRFNMSSLVGGTPYNISYIYDNYYAIYVNQQTYSLIKFDTETNTFSLVYSGLKAIDSIRFSTARMLCKNYTTYSIYNSRISAAYSKITLYIPSIDTEHTIGVNINGKNFYYNSFDDEILNNYILTGKKAFDVNGTVITGTMPNNGALNYTSSTSPQTIPTGYTSGGTIEAVDNTIDENIIAENIKKDVEILGVAGTYEGSISQQEYDECLNLTEDILDGTISLPYTALEYIEADGTQYINTLYKPTHRTSVEMSIATINLNDTFVPFGTRANGALAFILGINFNNKSYIQYNTNTAIYSTEDSTNLLNTKLLITLDNFLGRITYNGINIDMVPEDRGVFTCTTNLYLGCSNNNGTVQYIQPYKLYYFKIYESNALVNDFIPVKRISDNEICLYDKVTGTFFTNQGTGSYIAGPEV